MIYSSSHNTRDFRSWDTRTRERVLKRINYLGKLYFLGKVKDDDDTPSTVWEIADSVRPRKVVPYDSQPFPADKVVCGYITI